MHPYLLIAEILFALAMHLQNSARDGNAQRELRDQLNIMLTEVRSQLADGFAGRDVELGYLQRQMEATRQMLDNLKRSLEMSEAAQSLFPGLGASNLLEGIEGFMRGAASQLDSIARELGIDLDTENLRAWIDGLSELPEKATDLVNGQSQLRAAIDSAEMQIDHLSARLDARRAELAAEGAAAPAGVSAQTRLTPEELHAAYAPSAEMQARIDAVNESFGRLADPLLPELEARIESLCDVLEECASCACAEGRAEDMGIVMGSEMGADMKAAQPGIAPLATGEVRSKLEFCLAA